MKEQELFDWLKAGHYSDLEKSSNEYDGFEWVDKWLPTTTEFQDKSKTTKSVTFLPVELGIKLT